MRTEKEMYDVGYVVTEATTFKEGGDWNFYFHSV